MKHSVLSSDALHCNVELLRRLPSSPMTCWWPVAVVLLGVACSAAVEAGGNASVFNKNVTNVESHHNEGIHVASWRWKEIGVFYTLTLFIIICGLAKIAFHHAHFLSAHVPESCLMIIVGVTVGAIIHFSNAPAEGSDNIDIPKFTPEVFFLVLLPPIILEAAYSLYDRAFADNIGTVMLYAVVGTLINTFAIGALLYALFQIGAMGHMNFVPLTEPPLRPLPYNLTMTDCLVFSALISAVDPVAVLAIFQEIGVNKDLYYLVFGESLFNDAVTVVLYTTMVVFNDMDPIPPGQYFLAVVAFFTSSLGGLTIGILFGLLTALITKTTREIRVVEPLAVLGIAYLSYLTAELFHFSGIISIIGCGLCQAHYALRNISHKSYTTVIYFTKMLSSTSDAIIFLFLGIVVVSSNHFWHTGFVIWALVLCLACRFAGVFMLTAIANVFRVSHINKQEQFLMAYGGLRGAVAFSLVEMLDKKTVEPIQMFVTTTLVVIFFTVFIQGSTIKPLVNLLKIKKETTGKKQLTDEINENIMSNIMAGIEEITGVRGDFYVRQRVEYIDEHYLQKIFLVADQESDLTKLYKELSLVDHFAHLYGPVVLVEDQKTEIFRNATLPADGNGYSNMLMRKESFMMNDNDGLSTLSPGVQLRRRQTKTIDISNAEELRKAFKNHPKYKYPTNYRDENVQRWEQLKQRHMTARCITALVVNRQSLPVEHVNLPSNRQSLPAEHPNTNPMPRRQIHSDLEERYPEEMESIDLILERAGQRRLRSSFRSASEGHSPFEARDVEPLHSISETEMDVFLPSDNTHSNSAHHDVIL